MRSSKVKVLGLALTGATGSALVGVLAWIGWKKLRQQRLPVRPASASATSETPSVRRLHGRSHNGVSAIAAVVVLLVALVAVVSFLVVGKAAARRERAENLTGGHMDAAISLMLGNGCGGCHEIPGVPGADGEVGPSLAGVAARIYLGGSVANVPPNMIEWIRDSRGLDPTTAMPSTGISEQKARDIAAYLYTLR